jgi:hypothetical protein
MKLKLDQDTLNNDFFDNTRLLGIMAPLKNYFFCWQVNNVLGVKFRLNSDAELHLRKSRRDYYFNLYEWTEPESYLTHYIYHNQNDGNFLLPEFKNMDFLWLMKGDMVEDEKIGTIATGIRNISGVQLVAELTSEQIKNKGNMMF